MSETSSQRRLQPNSSYFPKVIDYSKVSDNYKTNSDLQTMTHLVSNSRIDGKEQQMTELKKEGLLIKEQNKCKYICKICSKTFLTIDLFVEHIRSEEHISKKSAINEIDKRFVMESQMNDRNVLTVRLKQLKRITPEMKQKYSNHGIRLKDGIGPNAYVCLSCNLALDSLNQMTKHYESFKLTNNENNLSFEEKLDLYNIPLKQTNKRKSKNRDRFKALKISHFECQTEEDIQKLVEFKKEGVIMKHKKKGDLYICLVCNQKRSNYSDMLSHIRSGAHLMTKSGENLDGIDNVLTIESENIDNIEVVLARIQELRKISITVKEEYHSHGIRLKDGVGPNAWLCISCNLSFETLSDVRNHLEIFEAQKSGSLLSRSADELLEVKRSSRY